eukprot:TRINITY_DN75254_c0_g1_i1.p1 TRINITY_DN75254_c0_g1~~TRINITY_DN75254_c0_g1_i1.p1  ORF type:complete len:476 (+),score=51.49 TRINITY_DN75254_c0_g1_i1:47-1474(+)
MSEGKKKSNYRGRNARKPKTKNPTTTPKDDDVDTAVDMTGLLIQYCQANNIEHESTCTPTENHRVPDHPEHECTIKVMANTVSSIGSRKKIARRDASRMMLCKLCGKDTDEGIVSYMKELKKAVPEGEKGEKPERKKREGGTKKGKVPKPAEPTRDIAASPLPSRHTGQAAPWCCLSLEQLKKSPEWATQLLAQFAKVRRLSLQSNFPTTSPQFSVAALSLTLNKVLYSAEFVHKVKSTAQALASRDILLQLFPGRNTEEALKQAVQSHIEQCKAQANQNKTDTNSPNVCVSGWELEGWAPGSGADLVYTSTRLNNGNADATMPQILAQICTLRYHADPEFNTTEKPVEKKVKNTPPTNGDGKATTTTTTTTQFETVAKLSKYIPGMKGVGVADTQDTSKAIAAEELLKKLFPARTRNYVKQSVELEARALKALTSLPPKKDGRRGGRGKPRKEREGKKGEKKEGQGTTEQPKAE